MGTQAQDIGSFLFISFGVLITIGLVVLVIVSLLKLKDAYLDDLARVMWALIILFFPLFGSIVFLIVDPGRPGRAPRPSAARPAHRGRPAQARALPQRAPMPPPHLR
ncbi:MAG: PLDc N-terminal domain-containing protein [Opitutales bacterium]